MSTRTIAQKLFIKPGHRVRLVNAPEGYEALLGALPEGATVTCEDGAADIVQVFVRSMAELRAALVDAALPDAVRPGGILWVSYPKATSGVRTDLNRDVIDAYAQTLGLRGVFMFSVDDTWSAMRLRDDRQAPRG